MNIQQIVEVVSEELSKYDNLDSIELEARLGIFDQENNRFDSNIGEENYQKLEHMLASFGGWLNVEKSSTIDYFSNNLRLSQNKDTKEQKCIEKVRIKSFTFISENLPMDIRISISRENPVAVSKFPRARSKLKQRQKDRVSREFQNAVFDLTRVQSQEMGEIVETFEYEVEHKGGMSNIPNSVFQMLYKVLDANYMIDGYLKSEGLELPLEMFSAQMV